MQDALILRVQGTWNKQNRVDNYKALLKKIDLQFEDSSHPFRELQRVFQEYAIKEYENFRESSIINAKDYLTKDISDLVRLFCFTLIKFYNLKLSLKERNADLFLVPITDLLVRDKIQDLLFQIVTEENNEDLGKIRKQLFGFRKVKLDKLKVNKYFCFDESFRDQFKIKDISVSQVEISKEQLFQSYQDKGKSGQTPVKCLAKSINTLLKLKEISSPNKKLKQILKVSKMILKEIDEFWVGYEVKREKLIMDPDSLLSLFIYVIAKAEYPEILLDHKFVELFITEADKNSTKGYYLVTLGIALDWMMEQDAENFSSVFFFI